MPEKTKADLEKDLGAAEEMLATQAKQIAELQKRANQQPKLPGEPSTTDLRMMASMICNGCLVDQMGNPVNVKTFRQHAPILAENAVALARAIAAETCPKAETEPAPEQAAA